MLEALSSKGFASDGIAHLIRLISLALHNAPESQLCFLSRLINGISHKGNTDTLRIVQTYVKECLDIFVNDAAKPSDLHIFRLPMLSFISDLCSKKVRC
jgi:hypothetical protein